MSDVAVNELMWFLLVCRCESKPQYRGKLHFIRYKRAIHIQQENLHFKHFDSKNFVYYKLFGFITETSKNLHPGAYLIACSTA